MARTIAQIEQDITNQAKLHIMEYVKDYLANKLNVEFGKLNTSLANIKNHVLGIDQITAQLGQPLAPSTTDPANPNEGDWYFNTQDKKFKMYHGSAWQDIADLSSIIDTTPLTVKKTTISADADVKAKLIAIKAARAAGTSNLVNIELKANHDVATNNGAIRRGTYAVLDADGIGNITESNAWSFPYVLDWDQVGGNWNILRSQNPADTNNNWRATLASNHFTWTFYELEGKVINGGGGAPTFGTLKELYDVENGVTVDKADEKVLHLKEIAELVKDQREIDKQFLASFTDDLTYKDANHIEYRDKSLDLVTLSATVNLNGSSLFYSTLVNPYDRIAQEQASFTGHFQKHMTVSYMFTSKGKGVRFSGNVGQTYKWETVGKFENNARVPYIRFTGTGTFQTTDDALNPSPSWTTQTTPFDMKLTDLMDTNNKTALVNMAFDTAPAVGDKLLEIDYLTSTFFIEQRFGRLLKDIEANNDAKYEPRVYDYSGSNRSLSRTSQSGKNYIIIDMPAGADMTPIGAVNKIKLGTAPAGAADADQVTYGTELIWIVKANGDIMNWSEIKTEVAAGKTMVIQHLSSGNWELVRWESVATGGGVTQSQSSTLDNTGAPLTVSRTTDGKIIIDDGDWADVPVGGQVDVIIPTNGTNTNPAGVTNADPVYYGSLANPVMAVDLALNTKAQDTWSSFLAQGTPAGLIYTFKRVAQNEFTLVAYRGQTLFLNLSNVDTDVKKTEFINGLRAIGIDTSLWGTFQGFLTTNPTTNISERDWYFNTTDNSIHAYYSGSWHNIGGGTTGTGSMDRNTILGVLGLVQQDLQNLRNLTNSLSSKEDRLTKTLTIIFTDGTSEDVKVG